MRTGMAMLLRTRIGSLVPRILPQTSYGLVRHHGGDHSGEHGRSHKTCNFCFKNHDNILTIACLPGSVFITFRYLKDMTEKKVECYIGENMLRAAQRNHVDLEGNSLLFLHMNLHICTHSRYGKQI